MPDSSFRWGFLAGFLVAGLFGYALQRARLFRQRMGLRDRRVPVFTERTPADVYRDSEGACLRMVVWSVVAVIILAVGIYILLM